VTNISNRKKRNWRRKEVKRGRRRIPKKMRGATRERKRREMIKIL
jgi:hypothetical protein